MFCPGKLAFQVEGMNWNRPLAPLERLIASWLQRTELLRRLLEAL